MAIDPGQLKQIAESKADENYDFRQFLKHHPKLRAKQIDQLVFGISAEVWKGIDCTTCGNCCREVSPTLDEKDVHRMACGMSVEDSEFAAQYLKQAESDSERAWIMGARPCPFLRDKRCSGYEHRPDNCRDYPYLDKPDFTSRTLSMIGRLAECPAVFEVWERLKVATGFHWRRRSQTGL
jgi:Fe-S-cluster containining protein